MPGYSSVDLVAADLTSQAAFYESKLGLPVIREGDAIRIELGDTELTFHGQSEGPPATYHLAFDIPCNQIASALDWVQERTEVLATSGVKLHSFASWNAEAFYFKDPAGNILECIARHGLDNARPGEFDSAGLLYVSELGVPVLDVSAALTQLRAAGLPVYGSPAADFAAVGEAGALAIVVSDGREWFGSCGRKAEMHPANAVLRHGGPSTDVLHLGNTQLCLKPERSKHRG
ncbi:MAG: glyoxalase/bleomycin resistance/dioxygenase family protein [Armatimonadetes bacterium]|nr:glyoxalase/bleomycin resistance/dioxygenase family protein [Armatimonadota bacterium]